MCGSRASLLGLLHTRVADQDSPHGAGARGEEVGPAPPADAVELNQLQIGLVDEGRRTQGVVGPLPAELALREPAQLLVNHRQQPVEGLTIPLGELRQNPGDIGVSRRARGWLGSVVHAAGCKAGGRQSTGGLRGGRTGGLEGTFRAILRRCSKVLPLGPDPSCPARDRAEEETARGSPRESVAGGIE